MNAQQHTTSKQHTKRLILTTVAVGAAGILGYFGWQYYKRKKSSGSGGSSNNTSNLDDLLKASTDNASASINFDEATTVTPATRPLPKNSTSTTTKKAATNDPGFPLKKGSKGEKVRQLQEALISKYGKSILPKYGADGDFGSEMAAALKKLGLPVGIDQSTFNVLTESSSGSSTNSSVGTELFNAAFYQDFNKTMAILKKMKSKDDYVTANEVFKTYRLGSVRQTIVNGLLNTFTSAEQKQKLKFEFLRMGLQYDGNQWSLSGIGGIAIITMIPTSVWMNAKHCVRVPARMILGNEISKRLGYTLFENRGKYFLVPTKAVQYL